MKRLLSACAIAACAFGADAYAAQDIGENFPGEFAGTVSIASDYTFRGISQSSEQPAIQGSIDYGVGLSQGLDLYLGVWASNVDFSDMDEATIEMDYYGGLTYEVQNLTFDLGGIYYVYPGAASGLDYDFFEIQAAMTYAFGGASLTGSVNYSPEYFGVNADDSFYYKLGTEIPLPTPFGISLDAHLGHQNIDYSTPGNTEEWTDWSVGLNIPFKGLDLRAAYVDTNLSDTDAACGSSICDGRAVFSVSKSF